MVIESAPPQAPYDEPITGSWPPRAIVFDCYGTLLRIADERHPYLRLAELAGGLLDPSPMIQPLSLADVVVSNITPLNISTAELERLEADLEAEIASVCPIGDALDALVQLRICGYRLGLVSNLAAPMQSRFGGCWGTGSTRKFFRSRWARRNRHRPSSTTPVNG